VNSDSSRNLRIKRIFNEAAERSGSDRDRLLDQLCGDSTSLRAEVVALLDADTHPAFLEGRPNITVSYPARIGRYAILRLIGEGGMGTVFEALQDSPRRLVALKLLRGGSFSAEALRRFEYETQVLAQLRHPGIAQIYESGTQSIGGASVPYFAMELIPGARSITEFAREASLDLRQRVELFADVCEAVQHGHQRGIIHRDLKPSNILVDDAGRSHVIDFGVARSVGANSTATLVTTPGQFLGTVPYMSPEQFASPLSSVIELDIRSDVYSLGVVLYELLCERPAFDVSGTDLLTAARSVRERSPVRPAMINRELRGDLETIMLKAIDKERARRYQTTSDFAGDLRRYLAGEAIEARRDSSLYLLRKVLHRYRWQTSAIALTLFVIAGAVAALTVSYARQGTLLTQIGAERDKARVAERTAEESFRREQYQAYVAHIAAADGAIGVNDGGGAVAKLMDTPAQLRNWEWQYLMRLADTSVATWQGPPGLMAARVALSRDGKFAGTSFWSDQGAGALRIWDRSEEPRKRSPETVLALNTEFGPVFAFDSLTNTVLHSTISGELEEFDLFAKSVIRSCDLKNASARQWYGLLSTNARTLVTRKEELLFIADANSGETLREVRLPEGARLTCVTFDNEGDRLAMGITDKSEAARVVIVNTHDDKIPAQTLSCDANTYGLAFAPTNDVLAVACGETGQVELWDLQGGVTADEKKGKRIVRRWQSGEQRVGGLAFNPDGSLLAAPSCDKSIRIWRVASGEIATTLRGHSSAVLTTSFGADGSTLISGDRSGEVKLWDLKTQSATRSFRTAPRPISSIALLCDQRRALVHCDSIHVLDLADGRELYGLPLGKDIYVCSAVVGPRADDVTFSNTDGTICVWKIGDSDFVRTLGKHAGAPLLAAAPQGRVLVSADMDTMVAWNWMEGRATKRIAMSGRSVRSLAMANDGAHVAAGMVDGDLLLVDISTGREMNIPKAHSGPIQSVQFNTNGSRLVSGSFEGDVKLWNAQTGDCVWSASLQLGDIWSVQWAPGDKRLAAAGRDRSVRILDSANGHELLSLHGPTGTVMCLTFSPDGSRLFAGTWAREVFVWDAGAPDSR